MDIEVTVDEEVEQGPSGFENLKKHLTKYKKEYVVGSLVALSFGLGFHFGNRGNSRHHYTRLLKDGVKGAVKEGMKDVVETGMKDVVKDGMRRVVEDVVTDAFDEVVGDMVVEVGSNVRKTVGDTVKNVIKESSITIIKEVESKPLKNKHVDEFQKILKHISDEHVGSKILYDLDGNTYTFKHDI